MFLEPYGSTEAEETVVAEIASHADLTISNHQRLFFVFAKFIVANFVAHIILADGTSE